MESIVVKDCKPVVPVPNGFLWQWIDQNKIIRLYIIIRGTASHRCSLDQYDVLFALTDIAE